MSEKQKTIFDSDHSGADDLPRYVKTKHGATSNGAKGREVVVDTIENMDLAQGEKVGPDTYTLVRNSNKKNFDRSGPLRESLVGMKEGVPGIYSGYQRTEKRYSKLDRTDIDPTLKEKGSPTRPPRKGRNKSDPSVGGDDGSYDHLWTPKASLKKEEEHLYSLLGSDQSRLYDDVEEGNVTEIILNSSPVNAYDEWFEDGKRFDSPDSRRNRPMSTVLLPISPVEGDQEIESDNESDWGSDFDESETNDQDENEDELYEIVGDMSKRNTSNRSSVYEDLNAVRAKTAQALKTPPSIANKPLPPIPDKPLPPLPDDSSSLHEFDEESVPYVDIIFDGDSLPHPTLPPLDDFASPDDIKRYQIIKYILENEKMYLTTLYNLIQDYEKPLRMNRIISQESVKMIFQHLQEIEQCHKLFNIALVGRMAEWNANPTIGDIIYASFSKSMVLKAYTSYVKNFISAMDKVKETCKSVPAFLTFLRNRLRKSFHKYSFYDLLKRPLGRFPQLVVLLQELLKVTPICHPDRLPLQMALTHLECLSELICDKRRDIEMKYKVAQLDKFFAGLNKPLFSNTRYYIRHDDMLLCKVVDGRVVKTKHRRIFLLSDLLICVSILNKSNATNMLTRKRYRVKWCVPVVEVDVVDVGSGIMVNIDDKKTTIKYTHPVSSPRPGAVNVEERLEDFQHDLAVIGQIAGLVASLRQSYDLINETKVSEWYRNVKETFDQEIEMANLHWLELSIPAKDKKTTTCLFNLHPPQKKIEWTTELENAKLRLGFDNNPGWFILEDESANIGNMGILRRNMPLLGNKVPLIMVESKYTIERILEVTPHGSSKPVLWIFSGNDHAGLITLIEMSMSSVPHVIESFIACEARILAAEVVKDEPNKFEDPSEQKTLIWCGTMSGRIQIFNGSSEDDHEEIASTKLRDSVLCFKHVYGKVFAGVANGTIACFRRKTDNSWDLDNPVIVCLSKLAVMDMTEARGKLWCASGNFIYILDIETLGTEHKIVVGNSSRIAVKHLVSYGSGVWASQWKSPKLHLYHNETFECLQSLSVATPLIRMKNDIDTQIQAVNIDKTYVTALLARGGLLWVGTDTGIVITYPLPRLGGVPQVSGKPCVSFHGHEGPVRCFYAFRVKRRIKHGTENRQGDDAMARSLFYVDPFDQAATTLNIPTAFPELVPEPTPESPDDSTEPFYYALEPDEVSGTTAKQGAAYEMWLKSFGENVKKVDPMFSPDVFELRNRQGSYNSDESMDSDTEFSFIEDKAKKNSRKASKAAASFSVNIRDSGVDGLPQGTVRANNLPGGMSPISETAFADMLGSFKGFDDENGPSEAKDDHTGSSMTDAGFVMLGKTNSGYEEPIPPPELIVTTPYATVNKDKNMHGNGTLKETASAVMEVDMSQSEEDNDAVVGSPKPSNEVLEKYKTEPLPGLPAKTLYEKSKEWDKNLGGKYENFKSSLPDSDDISQNTEVRNVNADVKVRDQTTASADGDSTCNVIYDEVFDENEVVEGLEKTDSTDFKAEATREEDANIVVKDDGEVQDARQEIEGGNVTAPISKDSIPVLDVGNVDEPELDFGENELKSGTIDGRDLKSPVFIKVTNPETLASIEGAIEVDPHPVIGRNTRFKSFSGTAGSRSDPRRGRSESMPSDVSAPSQGLPWSSKAGRQTEDAEADHHETTETVQRNMPGKLDTSPAKKLEHRESIYTPLLKAERESTASSLSGVGAFSFDNEMALSTSLAREKITRQSKQGLYASLISVANRDNEGRQDLLLQPMYVVSVGSGYLDLRRKQKTGGGLEFFMKLTASEPSPKLLIWKITA